MSKIAKKTIAVFIALMLIVGVSFSGTLMQAFSLTRTADANVVTASPAITTNVTSRVEYGKTFTLQAAPSGYTVTVKTPGNENATIVNNTVTANQVGIYEVVYNYTGKGDYASYSYNVECYMDYEYKFIVNGNGASIPSYVKVGATIAVPNATLYYLDEETGKYFPADNAVITCKVSGLASETYTAEQLAEGKTITTSQAGTYFFTYTATVGTGANVFTQEYSTQVQTNFSDEKAPTITISGVPTSSSVNTSVNLPAATVTDDYDERVKTTITVTHLYAGAETAIDVAEVYVDQKTGYADKDENGNTLYYKAADIATRTGYAKNENGTYATTTNPAEAVKAQFDNTTFKNFYPTEEGAYNITYKAEDSSGNSTATYSYVLTVSDTTAPVYKYIDQSLIPSNWGAVVKKDESGEEDEDDTTESINNKLAFPIPELYDNKDADSALKVSFTLRDKNSKTVIRFNNIYATEASTDSSYVTSDTYGESERTYYFFRYWAATNEDDSKKYTVDPATGKITGGELGENAYSLVYYDEAQGKITKGFFDFGLYNDRNNDKYGSYTVEYRAQDQKGNNSSRTYSINYQASFTDTSFPVIDFDAPSYIAFRNTESEVTIDNLSATDLDDARLDVQYYLVFKNSTSSTKYSDVIATGTKVKLDASAATTTLKLESIGNGNFTVTVDNIYGEEEVVTLGTADLANGAFIAVQATDSVGNVNEKVEKIELVNGIDTTNTVSAPVFDANTADGQTGVQYNVGSFTIDYKTFAMRNYTGFEMYVQRVQDEDGNAVENSPLNEVSFETYSDNRESGTKKIYVDNIRFTPTKSGTYMLVVRTFNVTGSSNVSMAFITVTGSDSGNVGTSASIPDTISYNEPIELPNNYTMPGTYGEGGVLRSITGGRFTLMGTEFTPLSATTYSFYDYVFKYDTTAGTLIQYNYTDGTTGVENDKNVNEDDLIADDNNMQVGGKYTNASDSLSATFNLLGAMPTYSEKGVYIKLPNISASSSNGNASSITLKVTDPDGNDVNVYDVENPAPSNSGVTLAGNEFAFEATVDGSYSLVYTATLNNQTSTVSYTIRVGDIVAPTFTANLGSINGTSYDGKTTPSVKDGDVFKFSSITVDLTGETESDLTYSRQLIGPENDTIATLTTRTGSSEYTLSTSGTYTVKYTVTDKAGNSSTTIYYITVTTSKGGVSTEAITTLSVVLIIVGVLLVAGVVIYLVKFRKRKTTK